MPQDVGLVVSDRWGRIYLDSGTSRYGLGRGMAPLEMPKLRGAFRFPLSSLNPASHSRLQHLALTSPLHRMACCGTRSTSVLHVI